MDFKTPKQNREMLTDEELSVLCYELSQLNQSGISWIESADLLLRDNPARRIRMALEAIQKEMNTGNSFASVLKETGQFPSYCIHMVEIGELTGRLDTVLAALSEYYKREHTLNETIQRAVTYPCVMTALTALIFLLLIRRIFPIFSQVFALFDSGMSPLASFLLGRNSMGMTILSGIAVLLFLVALLALILFHSRFGLTAFSRGRSSAAIGRARFSSAMSLMISSGLALDEALDHTGRLLEDTPLAPMCTECQQKLNDGTPFTEAVTLTGIFTGMEAGMLNMGFRTGTMESVMQELARRSQITADVRLNQSLNRFEYGLVILLCATVGSMLLTVMLPLLQMLSSLGG